ncbi:hypothetical protein KIN20_017907 [Parelaphostrongylus tenuis]|uniref:C2H2-type domain-containing protein n=1 Tax=Parelaphostrongylus tenuis TaxID=148309 RepID=A0AAD5MII8_PARTN|nr:hypothetical protein KIN20_017907 [Parelaphostrongylus tenuis]
MEDETKCGTVEASSGTYEAKPLHESNSIEPLFEPRQAPTPKEETDDDLLTVKNETGENWFCYATDLLNASSSGGFSDSNVPLHDNPSSGEGKASTEHVRSVDTKVRSHVCSTCGKAFIRRYHLKRHSLIHSSERASRVAADRHVSSSADVCKIDESPQDRLISEKKKVVKILQAADVKLKKEHGKPVEKIRQCRKCGKQFTLRKQYRRHISDAHRVKRDYTCEVCGAIFTSRPGRNQHRRVKHWNHLLMCPYEGCDHPAFRYNQSLMEHVRSIHTEDRPHECETCGKAFSTLNRLQKHKFTHTAESQFHCKCGVKFRHNSSLHKHKRRPPVHQRALPRSSPSHAVLLRLQPPHPSFTSPFGGDHPPTMQDLVSIHFVEKRFQWPRVYVSRLHSATLMENETKCGVQERISEIYETKEFRYESDSTEPRREHEQMFTVKEDADEDRLTVKEENGLNWVCYASDLLNASSSADVSGTMCPFMDRLLSNEKKVPGVLHATGMNLKKEHEKSFIEFPEQCVKCGRKYATKFLLQKHFYNYHLDERLTCEECGRKFGSIGGLNKHKRVKHRNYLHMCPYEGCDHPGYQCAQALTDHIRSVHTKVRPFVCNTCGKTFTSLSNLKSHSSTHSSESAFQCECGAKFRHRITLCRHQRLCLLH